MDGYSFFRQARFAPGVFALFLFSFSTLRHGGTGTKPDFRHSFRFFQAWEKRMRLEYPEDHAVFKER
jgi:hypothetical protein